MRNEPAFDTSERSRGCVDTAGGEYTHSWISFEVLEFNRNGNVRRKVNIKLDLFDAAMVAGLFQKAMRLRASHSERLASIADGTGY
jgi:hypothetical protein